MSETPLAGLPTGGPATLAAVRLRLSYADEDTTDDAELTEVIAAVNVLVRGLPIAARSVVPGLADAVVWDARITLGANMLAARLHRRRNTPDGVAAVGDLGPVYIQRNDPDVALLLALGPHTAPAVG